MNKRRHIVWRGQMTTPGRLMGRGLLHVLPGGLWTFVLLALPLLVMGYMGFCQRDEYGQVVWTLSTENFWRLMGYGVLDWSPDYLVIVARSLLVATVTTVICVALAYPIAFFIAARKGPWRYVWLCLIAVPLCTNLVVRTYAWMLMLSSQMPVARAAQWMGMVEENSSLYPSWFAVYLGMVSLFLPTAVLPIYASVERIDRSLIEAARDLYGSGYTVFRHAVLPQTLPGLGAGVILTFIPALGTYVVPDLLGGGKTMLIGNLLQQQFGPAQDLPFGSLVGTVLTAVTLAGLVVFWRIAGKREVGR
jgi:spermidine/putrescine transport system permease protein